MSVLNVVNYLTYQPTSKSERKNRRKILAYYPHMSYQIDIMDYSRRAYNGFRYILTCINVYSRFALAEPLKSRAMAQSVISALTKIFSIMGPPKFVNADQEFNNQYALDFFQKQGVKHVFFSQPYVKTTNAVVERFHRTLAGILLKLRMMTGVQDWPNDLLPKAINIYNRKYHRTIQASPIKVFLGLEESHQDMSQPILEEDKKFQVGDLVVGPKFKQKAHKGFLKKDIIKNKFYYVPAVEDNRIYVKDLKLRDVPGYFMPDDMRKVKPEEINLVLATHELVESNA
jgi:hypothetical protein